MWTKGIDVGQAFDCGSPSPALMQEIEAGRVPTGRALVPGCGRGYDVFALADKDRKAVGVELAEVAVQEARKCPTAGSCKAPENAEIIQGNFFDLDSLEKYNFIYDYTFLCALDPSIRTDWAKKMADLCTPGGILMTLIFPIMEVKEGGPPFKVSLELVESLLTSVGFTKLQCELLPPSLCHPGRGDGSVANFDGSPLSGIGRWRRDE